MEERTRLQIIQSGVMDISEIETRMADFNGMMANGGDLLHQRFDEISDKKTVKNLFVDYEVDRVRLRNRSLGCEIVSCGETVVQAREQAYEKLELVMLIGVANYFIRHLDDHTAAILGEDDVQVVQTMGWDPERKKFFTKMPVNMLEVRYE